MGRITRWCRAIAPFFGLAFGPGWGVAALAIVFAQPLTAAFGPMGNTNPASRWSSGQWRSSAGAAWRSRCSNAASCRSGRASSSECCGAWWHLPAFLLSGTPQNAWSFGPFVLGALAITIILTPMFNAARGSLLIPILFHFQANLPLWPPAQPLENVVFALAAVIIALLNRESMLSRDKAVTDVLLS